MDVPCGRFTPVVAKAQAHWVGNLVLGLERKNRVAYYVSCSLLLRLWGA